MTSAPHTLRGRLVAATGLVLLVALLAFGAGALVLVDHTQRAMLDEHVRVAANAVAVIPDVVGERVTLDAADHEQIGRIVGPALDAEVVDAHGAVVVAATSSNVPLSIRNAASTVRSWPALSTVGRSPALRVAAAPIARNGHVYGLAVVWGDLDPIGELDKRLGWTLALAIPLVLLAATLGANVAAGRALRPIVRLSALASEIEGHDLSRRIGFQDRDDELGRLCAAFDRMLDRLEAAFEGQRRFTSDASHELRAPLSVIRAEADLALRKPRTPAEYERALRAIATRADDLEALTRDLLAVARGAASATTVIDAGEVMRDAASRLGALAEARDVAVAVDAAGPLPVRADFATLSRAIVCVLHNALGHAPRGTQVALYGVSDGPVVRISVRDAGSGFTADALVHAAERFWRDDGARSPRPADADASGAGLGLAIAKAIVEAVDGTLNLANGPSGGALVTLELPSPAGSRVGRRGLS